MEHDQRSDLRRAIPGPWDEGKSRHCSLGHGGVCFSVPRIGEISDDRFIESPPRPGALFVAVSQASGFAR
jgi:hypothetical protein